MTPKATKTPDNLSTYNPDAWRGHNSQTLPSKWKIVDGLLMFDPAGEKGGDIITKKSTAN
jgi:hypothetical protein